MTSRTTTTAAAALSLLVVLGVASCHTALPPSHEKDPELAVHAKRPGEPSIPVVLNVVPIAVDRRTVSGAALQSSVVAEPPSLPVYYPRLANRAIPRDVTYALRSLHFFPSVVDELDALSSDDPDLGGNTREEVTPRFVRLHFAVDRYEIAFARRNGLFWFPGLPLSLAFVLPGTPVGDETFVGYLEIDAALTAGDDPHTVILRKRYHVLREVDLDECDRRILPFTSLSAPDLFEAENYEAASTRMFPFLVRDFTRQIIADLARDEVAAAIVEAKPTPKPIP